jgi:hypothetical protein
MKVNYLNLPVNHLMITMILIDFINFNFIRVIVRVIIITFNLVRLSSISSFKPLHFSFIYLRFHPYFIIRYPIIFLAWLPLGWALLLVLDIFELRLLLISFITLGAQGFLWHPLGE